MPSSLLGDDVVFTLPLLELRLAGEYPPLPARTRPTGKSGLRGEPAPVGRPHRRDPGHHADLLPQALHRAGPTDRRRRARGGRDRGRGVRAAPGASPVLPVAARRVPVGGRGVEWRDGGCPRRARGRVHGVSLHYWGCAVAGGEPATAGCSRDRRRRRYGRISWSGCPAAFPNRSPEGDGQPAPASSAMMVLAISTAGARPSGDGASDAHTTIEVPDCGSWPTKVLNPGSSPVCP